MTLSGWDHEILQDVLLRVNRTTLHALDIMDIKDAFKEMRVKGSKATVKDIDNFIRHNWKRVDGGRDDEREAVINIAHRMFPDK